MSIDVNRRIGVEAAKMEDDELDGSGLLNQCLTWNDNFRTTWRFMTVVI